MRENIKLGKGDGINRGKYFPILNPVMYRE